MIPIRDARGRDDRVRRPHDRRGRAKISQLPRHAALRQGPHALQSRPRRRPPRARPGRVIVVEGYMDVIALAQAGIGEVVAPLGTALTEAQLERLWRMVDVPMVCFDGDAAGQKAAMRAAHRALPMLAPGRSLAFATLPPGQDPDDLVRAAGRGGDGGGARARRAAGRAAMAERTGRRAARHAGAARRAEAGGWRTRPDDRRPERARRISGRVPPPLRRAVRAPPRAPFVPFEKRARRAAVEAARSPPSARRRRRCARPGSTACWPRRCSPG